MLRLAGIVDKRRDKKRTVDRSLRMYDGFPMTTVRLMRDDEWDAVAELIFSSTNRWYQKHLNRTCFGGDDASVARVFPEVYGALDPGQALVAEVDGVLAGSCFVHPRETHVSLGIMNAAQEFAGRGVARALLDEVIRLADGKPVRLVSSALNLDSYSLYTRAGFAPYALYQDMLFPEGRGLECPAEGVRPAMLGDVDAMVALEDRISGIRRAGDFRHFIENPEGIWSVSVMEGSDGLVGFLASVDHPGCRMLGPGVMGNTECALALITAELKRFEGASPVFLIPAEEHELIARLYAAGARNCELHVAQCLGVARKPSGVVMPSFLPESA